MTDRPIYTVRFRAEPRVNAILALRAMLKYALRRCGLRCVEIEETIPASEGEEPTGRWRDVA